MAIKAWREEDSRSVVLLPSNKSRHAASCSVGLITEFVEPDGAIVFSMPELVKVDLALADIGPGETLELSYVFNAAGSTGFGETGFFAQIGDPFDLSASGARFEMEQVPDAVNAVPEPGICALLVAGLLALAGRRTHGHSPGRDGRVGLSRVPGREEGRATTVDMPG